MYPIPPHPVGVEAVGERVHHVNAAIQRAHHGGGWLLSGIICINIITLGCALVSGSAFNSVLIPALHQQIFIIILLILTMLWMLFYTVVTSRQDQGVLFKDSHAGPVWLRGENPFGCQSFISELNGFDYMVLLVIYMVCTAQVAFPVVQAVFLFVQTYFLWIHAKDCVQLDTNFTRCGLTLMLSTNLVVWMAAVIEESNHQTEIFNLNVNISYGMYRGIYCKCSHSACDTFKKAFYYLYPFNIEYSLFASTMAYIMWKNVGRLVEDHGHHRAKLRPKDVCLGPSVGILMVVAGLVTFIAYKVDIIKDDEKRRSETLLIHYILNIVILSLMSISTLIGCVIYRLDHREHVSQKNPTRSLDVWLLVGASMGQFIISYFSIVAVVATGIRVSLNGLNLTCALLTVLQLGIQNYFIIEGLHREPFHMMQEAALHTNAHAFQEHTEISIIIESSKSSYFPDSSLDKPNWKRRVVKEVCSFLLLANILLWIMPAFGARPHFEHPVEIKFYKFTMWAAIVNVGLPFAIFYRMHSVASLIELYLHS
uniref:Proton channel OTOP2-like n=1 Tax=Mastacembelus armatus TaxID=205130 RepID=A0A3Q3NGS2_9TELE